MCSRLPRLLALFLSLLVLTDAESLSLVSIEALAQAAEEANSETGDDVQSSAEGQITQDESSKGDTRELSANSKDEGTDEDTNGEEQGEDDEEEETEEKQPEASGTQPHFARTEGDKPKIETVARQEPVEQTAGKADPILALAQRKDKAPMHLVAAQAGAHDALSPPSRERQFVQSGGQPSGKSTTLLQRAVPNVVPSDVDTVSYLAESENQERIALTAENVAASAEAAVATSTARVQKTKAFVEELRKSASAQGQDADKDERVQMSTGRVRVAERELSTTVSRAKRAMTVAKQARLAALQLSSKVFPHVKFVSASTSLIQAYGPQSCISTWRDSQSGKCYLKTDCAQVPGFAEYDIGFLCESEGQESAEHRFGASSFAAQEIQQTSVACDRCLPLPDESVASGSTDPPTPASQTLLRGASAAPLN